MYGYKENDHLLSSSMAGEFKVAKSQEPKPLVDLEKLRRDLGQKNQRLLGAKPVAEIKPERPISAVKPAVDAEKYR